MFFFFIILFGGCIFCTSLSFCSLLLKLLSKRHFIKVPGSTEVVFPSLVKSLSGWSKCVDTKSISNSEKKKMKKKFLKVQRLIKSTYSIYRNMLHCFFQTHTVILPGTYDYYYLII